MYAINDVSQLIVIVTAAKFYDFVVSSLCVASSLFRKQKQVLTLYLVKLLLLSLKIGDDLPQVVLVHYEVIQLLL